MAFLSEAAGRGLADCAIGLVTRSQLLLWKLTANPQSSTAVKQQYRSGVILVLPYVQMRTKQ